MPCYNIQYAIMNRFKKGGRTLISFLNLQYFLLLSEELNFNNTAKKLHVTQQTLSGHIKKMEHDLGVKLFNYGPPLEITPAGLLLKAHAEVLLNQMKKMEMDIAKFKTSQSGSLKLGCTFSRAQFMMPAIIRDFQQKYPLVQLQMFEGNTPEIEDLLIKKHLDVTIGYIPETQKGITSLPLYDDPFILVVHPSVLSKCFPSRNSHQFRFYNEQYIRDILSHCPYITMSRNTLVGEIGREYMKKLGITPVQEMEVRDVGTMLSLCYAEMGFMLCPKTLVACCHYPFSKGHIIHPLPGHIGKTLAINYPSEEAKSPILKAFIQIVRENLQEYITDAGKE